jgi:hypothetical protein
MCLCECKICMKVSIFVCVRERETCSRAMSVMQCEYRNLCLEHKDMTACVCMCVFVLDVEKRGLQCDVSILICAFNIRT